MAAIKGICGGGNEPAAVNALSDRIKRLAESTEMELGSLRKEIAAIEGRIPETPSIEAISEEDIDKLFTE